MSTEEVPISPQSWPTLSAVERRVLGVLVEKAKTTPEAYPLSRSALTTGSNQKSNREPVMNVNDEQVDAALGSLQQRGLVTKITGTRVDRWRHNLYEQWQVDKVELAILTELLLRGPQTEGELRGRASRMEPIADLETLRQKLRPLAERKLILWLGGEGRRGAQIAPAFCAAEELDRLKSALSAAENAPAPELSSLVGPARSDDSGVRSELAAMRDEVEQLQSALKQMQDDVRQMKTALGI
jgi:uncharacterized protein YceH (UPF0502 family)